MSSSRLLGTARQRAALWPTTLFIGVTIVALGLGLIFQTPGPSRRDVDRYRILFSPEELDGVVKLGLKNRLGQFTFEKSIEDGSGQWAMTTPRSLPAARGAIDKVLRQLREIRIRKMFPEDAINISNFSLDSPVSVITLQQSSGEETTLNLGLVNPIDNSTYVQVPERKAIFHIDSLPGTMESMDINEFIDSRVFLTQFPEIHAVKFTTDGKGRRPKLALKRQEGQWLGEDGRTYDDEEVQEVLRPLLAIRAQVILDKVGVDTQTSLDKALSNPALIVEFEDEFGRSTSYAASLPMNAPLPEVKMEVRPYVVVRADGRHYIYLLGKDQQTQLKVPAPKPKGQLLKKIFY